jgi:hypothetical protein
MVLERVRQQIMQKKFQDQIDSDIRYLLSRLKESVESKRPLRLWTKGDHDWDETVDDMEGLGWIKTYERRGITFYKPTQQGLELYQQLVQEGYSFPKGNCC